MQVLRVKHIVVLGHAQCGGIRAFIDKIEPLSPGDFIGNWMQMFIKPGEVVEQRDARDRCRTSRSGSRRPRSSAACENLMTFPFVNILVERGELQLHGAYFGVAEGSLSVLDQETGQFHGRDRTRRDLSAGETVAREIVSPPDRASTPRWRRR